MRRMMTELIKYLLYGISLGCTFLVMMCLIFFLFHKEDIVMLIFQDFVRQAFGAMLVGIACGSTAVIYQMNNLSERQKRWIHFIVGMGVFYPVAIHLHWIPFSAQDIVPTMLRFLCSCGIFAAIWFCFYLFNRYEASVINNRIKKLAQDQNQTSDEHGVMD